MLKLIYLESSLHIEWLSISVAEFIANRQSLATTIGHSITIESGYASMLLALDPHQLAALQVEIALESDLQPHQKIDLCNADEDYLEVSFAGIWISNNLNQKGTEGIFVASLGDRLEGNLYNIWHQNQPQFTLSA